MARRGGAIGSFLCILVVLISSHIHVTARSDKEIRERFYGNLINSTAPTSGDGSFAQMFDKVLEKEFSDNDLPEGLGLQLSFLLSRLRTGELEFSMLCLNLETFITFYWTELISTHGHDDLFDFDYEIFPFSFCCFVSFYLHCYKRKRSLLSHLLLSFFFLAFFPFWLKNETTEKQIVSPFLFILK